MQMKLECRRSLKRNIRRMRRKYLIILIPGDNISIKKIRYRGQ
jgi:hypothetical protein